ncbi:MAG TPA: transketolase [Thermoleophilia bacterium]|nr:transketolase [Thermoleophilia bacterium]
MTDIDQLAVNTIRVLAIEGVEKAASGHPGLPLGAAPMAHVLWSRHLKFDPRDPKWPDRDRFILSAGHGSMLLYSLLHVAGYDLSLDDLKQFRQWGSRTPGHPENGVTPGVEVTTGPLGQGFANGVGMAITERFLAATFSPDGEVVDHHVYTIVGDGDLMEGISSEAASLAGHLGLGRLICLYDDNHISIEGSTDLAFTENVGARFEAYDWHVQRVSDGNDLEAIDRAITVARAVEDRPSLIMIRTHIGYGSPNKHDSADAHGAPLGAEEVRLTKQALGWTATEEFFVPEDVRGLYAQTAARGIALHEAWSGRLEEFRRREPEAAADFSRALAGDLPAGWQEHLPVFTADVKGMATRSASGKVLNAVAGTAPTLMGGSADLAPSNNTELKECGSRECGWFQKDTPGGRNVHFGVREHAMGGVLNGMALHGGVFPYGGTFLVFSDYMRPSIRLAALSHARVTYVFTHDSVGLGEDGPTHQPVEHLAALRVIPNLVVIRPADANETVVAWKVALERRDGPVALVLSRQNLPTLDRGVYASAAGTERGAYVLTEATGGPEAVDAIVLASGSEVHVALEARAALEADGLGVRVVSMASWELFEAQGLAYQREVLPAGVRTRVAVEAAVSFGWERWVGDGGSVVGIDRFGASAPGAVVLANLGITSERVVEAVKGAIDAQTGEPAA